MVAPQLRHRFQKLDSSTEQFWRDIADIKSEAVAVTQANDNGRSVPSRGELQELAGLSADVEGAEGLDSVMHSRAHPSQQAAASAINDLQAFDSFASQPALRSQDSFLAAAETAELNAQHSSMRLTDQISELRRGLAAAKALQSSTLLFSSPAASVDGSHESISPVRPCIDDELQRLPEMCDAQAEEIVALQQELESVSHVVLGVRGQLDASAEACEQAKSRLLSRISRFEDLYVIVMAAEEHVPSRWGVSLPSSEFVGQLQQSVRCWEDHSLDLHALDSELRRKLSLARRKVARDNEVVCSLQEDHSAGLQRQKELRRHLAERELLVQELGQSVGSHFAQRQNIAYMEERAMEDQHRLQAVEASCLRARGALSAEDRGRAVLLEDMRERQSCLESELRTADSEGSSLRNNMERLRCQLEELQTSALKGPSEPVLLELAQRDEAGWSLNNQLVDMWTEESSAVRFAESERAAEAALQLEVTAERSALMGLEMCEAELALEERTVPTTTGMNEDRDCDSGDLEDMRRTFDMDIRTLSAELDEGPRLEHHLLSHSSLLGNLQAMQETLSTQSVQWQRERVDADAADLRQDPRPPAGVSGLERALRAWDNVLGTPPASPLRSLEPPVGHFSSPPSPQARGHASLNLSIDEPLPLGDWQPSGYPPSAHEDGLHSSGYYPLSPASTRDAPITTGSLGDPVAPDRWSFGEHSTAASPSPSPPWPQALEGWSPGISVPVSPPGGSEVAGKRAVSSALDALDALLAGKSS